MKLKELITKNNLALYKRISAQFPVQLKKSDEDIWSSALEDKRVIISYSKTDHPEACFAHELLHIDIQLNGYRKLRSGLSLNNGVQQQLPFLCPIIDNEFQHHKMYARFLEMGFAPSEFYHESDSVAEHYIANGIQAKGQSVTSITSVYFTLIAPGNLISSERVPDLKEQFRNYDEGVFRDRFDKMDKIMESWRNEPSYNARPYVQELLGVLGCNDSWIAYVFDANDFPNDGFFVGTPFTLDDIYKAGRLQS